MHFSGIYITATIRFHRRPLVIDETMFSKVSNFREFFYELASRQWFEKVRKVTKQDLLFIQVNSLYSFFETDKKERSDFLDRGFIARYTYNHLRRASIRTVMLTSSIDNIQSFFSLFHSDIFM